MSFFDLIQSSKCNVKEEITVLDFCCLAVVECYEVFHAKLLVTCWSRVGHVLEAFPFLGLPSVPLVTGTTQHGLLYMKSKILQQEKEMYDNDIIHPKHVLYG